MTKKRAKIPATSVSLGVPKKGVSSPAPDLSSQQIVWRLGRLDIGGPWCATALTSDLALAVRAKLADYETMTWGAAAGKRGVKQIPVEHLALVAQKRLEDIKQDDLDGVWEFHLTGLQRVWGIRDGPICYLLWWDPDHVVCPSTRTGNSFGR